MKARPAARRIWLAALAGLALCWIAAATRADESDLYKSPTLAIDPGKPTAPIRGLNVDAAGEYAVIGGDDRTLRVWKVKSGELALTIHVPIGPGYVGSINAVAISPDGLTIAAGGWTGSHTSDPIYIFERATGLMTRSITTDLPSVVFGLAFSRDNRFLAAVLGGGKGLRVFDSAKEWKLLCCDDKYGDLSIGVAFAPGRLATTSYDGFLRLYAYDENAAEPHFRRLGEPSKAPSGQNPFGVAFSPDGQRLAIGYRDAIAVDVLDAISLQPLGPPRSPSGLRASPDGLTRVAWSRDGQTLFAGGAVNDAADARLMFAWDRSGLGEERRFPYCAPNAVNGIAAIPNGNILVAGSQPCLGVMSAGGEALWAIDPPNLDLRGDRDRISLSPDGKIVEFDDWRIPGRLRFDTSTLELSEAPVSGGTLLPPLREGLDVKGWHPGETPSLDDKPIPLRPYEIPESLALANDARQFYLGTNFGVAAFDVTLRTVWRADTASAGGWAVNASRDGKLVVVAYFDGSIRWLRATDGAELLALQVLPGPGPVGDWKWVLWTPEGYYAANRGAEEDLRWIVNHGPNAAATAYPVSQFKYLRQPAALKLVLDNLETARALGLAKISEDRLKVKSQTGSEKAPGGTLYLLSVGITDFGAKAHALQLPFGAKDAKLVYDTLLTSQTPEPDKATLYADVAPVGLLIDGEANKRTIQARLDSIAANMMAHDDGHTRDTAVIFITTHGEMIDGKLYLMTNGVDLSTGNKNDIADSALPVERLADKIEAIAEHGHVLVLLDACHSGGLGDALDVEALLSALDKKSKYNVTVLTSTQSKAEVSYQLPSYGHSAFTQSLLDALHKGDRAGIISVGVLAENMRGDLEQLTRNLPPPQQHLGSNPRFLGDLFVVSPL